MKKLFIPTKSKKEFSKKIIEKSLDKLPEKIALVYSIQYEDTAKKLKKQFQEKNNKEITLFQQVLGCSNIKPILPEKTQAILLIGSGIFHALELYDESKIPVYILGEDNFREITNKDIESFKKNKKASYMNFLNADSVGLLITTKPGQKRFSRALEIKEKIQKKYNKKVYLFISDEINISEFENFPYINSWINTACPRMDIVSNKIINAEDIPFG